MLSNRESFRNCALTVAVVAFSMLTSGCATRQVGILTSALPPSEPLKPNARALESRQGLSAKPLPGERLVDVIGLLPTGQGDKGGLSINTEAAFSRALVEFENRKDTENKEKIRNLVFSQLIDASINNCNVYLNNVRGSQIGTRSFFDLSTGLLSGAAGVVRPEESASILSALAAFSNGAGASIDRNVFSQVAAEIVIRRIHVDRYVLLEELNKKKFARYSEWDLSAAMVDASRFHWMCTVAYGLSSLEKVSMQNDLTVAAVRGTVDGLVKKGASAETIQGALAGLLDAAGPGGVAETGPVGVAETGPVGVAEKEEKRDDQEQR